MPIVTVDPDMGVVPPVRSSALPTVQPAGMEKLVEPFTFHTAYSSDPSLACNVIVQVPLLPCDMLSMVAPTIHLATCS